MSNTTLDSRAIRSASNATTSNSNDVLRDLIAAMPIVIFYKAARAALQRRSTFVQR